MSEVIRHIIVRGRVQGVGYRAWLADEAVRRHLAGWVRNRRDSTVEAVLAGPEDEVSVLLAASWQGPALARVTEIGDEPASTAMLGLRRPGETFSILPTI